MLQVVDDERQARRAFEEELLAKVERETRQLRQLIDMEKTVREEATMNMISMIEKTRQRMQHDMEKARAERAPCCSERPVQSPGRPFERVPDQ